MRRRKALDATGVKMQEPGGLQNPGAPMLRGRGFGEWRMRSKGKAGILLSDAW